MKAKNKEEFIKEWTSHVRELSRLLYNFEGEMLVLMSERLESVKTELNGIIEEASKELEI